MNIKRGDMPANPATETQYYDGMTIRERFAMAAMKGLLSNPTIADQSNNETQQWIAERAREQTDAMLSALERTK